MEAGYRTLVVLRVAASIEGEAHEPFSSALDDDNVGIAVATFVTGGEMHRLEFLRFFSDDSRAQGWTYFFVPPGTFYLAFLPPRHTDLWTYLAMFESAQRWRVDVRKRSKVVYAGTLAVDGEGGSLLFGGQYLKNFRHLHIRNERDEAQSLVDRHIPGMAPIETAQWVHSIGWSVRDPFGTFTEHLQ